MALRNIVKDGDSILLKKSRQVERFDKKLHQLLDDMAETMQDANGAGLAAPQVGVLRCVCLVEADPEKGIIELINPEIIVEEGEQNGAEGCLSFPGEYGLVKRPMRVTVKAQNRDGEWFEMTGDGLTARAFCHEIDHLHGRVFKSFVSRMLTDEELESGSWREELENEEKEQLE